MEIRKHIRSLNAKPSVWIGMAVAVALTASAALAQNLIQGQIMAPTTRQMIVRIETNAGTVYQEVYSSPDGRFIFQDAPLDPDQFYFLTINEEGFKPYRERLDYRTGGRRDNRLFVYLEREDGAAVEGGPRIIDLSQLGLDVPDDAIEAYNDAMAAVADGDREEAVEQLEHAVERAPDFFNAQDELGALYVEMGRYEEAEAALNTARELSPSESRPLLNLGTMHYKIGEAHFAEEQYDQALGEFIEAANTLEQVIRMDPQAGMAYQNMGAALYRLQELSAAEALLQRGLEIDPGLHESRLLLVNVYNRMARFDDAIAQLDAYIDANPATGQRAALERMRENIERARDAEGEDAQ